MLEQTRILREERRRHQLEENSATKVQKVFRGWKGRQFVARSILEVQWQQQRQQRQQSTKTTAEAFLARESFLLSLLLSSPLLPALEKESGKNKNSAISTRVDSWLLEHATSIQQCTQQQQQQQQSPYALSFRIVQAALSRLRPLQQQQLRNSNSENFAAMFCIVDYYLRGASPLSLERRVGGADGILCLLQSAQECLWWQAANNNNSPQSHSMQEALWGWSCQAVKELETTKPPLKQVGHAMLAAIVMGHHSGVANGPSAWWCNFGGTAMSVALYEANFAALVEHSLQQTNNTNTSPSTFAAASFNGSSNNNNSMATAPNDAALSPFSKALSSMLQGRWHLVLSNALDWQQVTATKEQSKNGGLPSTALLQFLHHVLTHHNDLAILTSMVAKGDDVRSMVLLQRQQQQSTMSGDDDDVDDILEEEMEEETAGQGSGSMETAPTNMMDTSAPADNQNASSKKHKSSSSGKLSKQDLQTVPQLERYYQEGIQRQRNQTISLLIDQARSSNSATKAYAESMVEMAVQIGNPSLWISWGDMLLVPTDSDSGSSLAARQGYVQLLARVLQSVTGLRSRTGAGSPFLSQLAFAGGGTMIEKLWTALLEGQEESGSAISSQDVLTCTMLTVFCDVFAHSLIALSDEKFLQQYTTNVNSPAATTAPKTVMADQVISHLRTLLHEVYWRQPVILGDVKLASDGIATSSGPEDGLRAMRARFLLSGTKLWSSLYERWCRLVRTTPFCDESAWWFPHLASQEGDNAVVNSEAHNEVPNDLNGVVAMDIDDDSDSDDEDAREDQGETGASQSQAMTTAEVENDALASSFRDPKMARVLTCIAFAIPFDRRVRLFDSLLSADKLKTQDENAEFRAAMVMMMRGEENPMSSGRERVEIRRDRLYDDSMRQLNQLGSKLKKKIQVSFVNQHGTQEAGIDGGGVFKEFVDDLIKDAFSIDSKDDDEDEVSVVAPRLFSVTPLQTLTVNSSLPQDNGILAHYEFLGRVLGKAVYESILVEPQFCLPFLNQLLGKRNSLEDLKNFDMEYYKNLTKLLSLNEAEIEGLDLTFELTLGEGQFVRTVELLPGGKAKSVTKQNVIQYVHLVSHQRLNVQGAVQTKSFLHGFRDLIPASWVRLFSAYELQKLISGDDSLRGFDVPSLKRAMKYAAGYHPSQQVMMWFWEVIEELSPDQQRKFLKFMTSCSRQPLLGFHSLDPPPCVQQIRLPDTLFELNDVATVAKSAPLPTSSTCMNLLKLPNYRSKELMKQKILQSIESGAGFELT